MALTDLDLLYKRMRNFALTKPVRSRSWLQSIKHGPCVICHRRGTDPHHIFGSVHGLKSSDLFTVPLCRECHDKHDGNVKANAALMEVWMHLVHDILREGL
jgi:hypothetical protein